MKILIIFFNVLYVLLGILLYIFSPIIRFVFWIAERFIKIENCSGMKKL